MYVRPSEAEKYTGIFEPSWLYSVGVSGEERADGARRFVLRGFRHPPDPVDKGKYRTDAPDARPIRVPIPGLARLPRTGTCTIGLLDVFWDSKGLIEPEAFRAINDERVLMRSEGERCMPETRSLPRSSFRITDRGRAGRKLTWRRSKSGAQSQGTARTEAAQPDGICRLGTVIAHTPTDEVNDWKLMVIFEWDGGQVRNEWEFWSFPRTGSIPGQERIFSNIEALQPVPDARREYERVFDVHDTSRDGTCDREQVDGRAAICDGRRQGVVDERARGAV